MISSIFSLKKKKITMPPYQQFLAFLDHNVKKLSVIHTLLHFLSFLPIIGFRINLLLKISRLAIFIISNLYRFLNQNQYIVSYSSSLIPSFEGIETIILATWQLMKAAKKENFKGVLIDFFSKKEDNNVFLN